MDTSNNNLYVFWIVGLVVGAAACAAGIRAMVNGEAVLVLEEGTATVTGVEAFWCGGNWLCLGAAMLGLILVGPRALETRSKRGSYSPPQTISLIACVGLLVFAICSMVVQYIYFIGKWTA